MPLFTSLTALSQTPGANPPDGGSDAPSSIDDNLRLLGSFSALLRDAAHVYVASIAGTNTITGNIATNPTSYTVGQVYRFVAAGANTGAVTLNFNSIGAKNLLKVGNVALTGGELQGTAVYEAVYDGVSFQLVGMYGFKSSLGASGYQRLPTGLTLQWGSVLSSGTAAGNATVSFPIAFTSTPYIAIATPISTGSTANIGVQVGNLSNTTLPMTTVQNATFVSGIGAYWFALGN